MTTLFQAIKAATDIKAVETEDLCQDHEVDHVVFDNQAGTVLLTVEPDMLQMEFKDQDVTIDGDGMVTATTIGEDGEPGEVYELYLTISRPVTENDAVSYRIEWKGYDGDPAPETHVRGWFVDAMGFDNDDQAAIDGLAMGQAVTLAGIGESVTITRVS